MTQAWARGRRHFGLLELDEYLKCVRVQIPYHVVAGAEDGPTLYIQACQHGTEINGWAACREILEKVTPEGLRGTLIVVPVANPIAFQARLHGYPTEGHNMNRVWPGDARGPFLPYRMTALLYENLIMLADAAIDFHCWGDMGLPMAWTYRGRQECIRAFGTPYIMEYDLDDSMPMLQAPCERRGIPFCAIEMIPQDRIKPESAALGVTGALNLMRWLGMLEGPMDYPAERFLCAAGPVDESVAVTSEGMWVPLTARGIAVEEGQLLGRVHDWITLEPREEIRAPWSGLLYTNLAPWDRRNTNLVEPGDVVVTLRKLEAVLAPPAGPGPGEAALR